MSTNSGDYTALVPITGEAVALDLRLAQFPSRTLALALDVLIQYVALIGVVWFAGAVVSQVDDAAAVAVGLVSVVMVLIGMPTLIETLTRGRSVGKIAAGLRVVRDDGGPVRFRHSFVRALFMLVDFWLTSGVVGLISSLVSSRGKRLGDHFAGTVLIRERVSSAAAVGQLVYQMPPGLESWAATLELTRLPDATALQSRQFLSRATAISPQVRAAMGLQLAAEVSSYVSPAAPAGIHPETYLAAVLTERMRRAAIARPIDVRSAFPATAPTARTVHEPGRPASVHPSPESGPFAVPR